MSLADKAAAAANGGFEEHIALVHEILHDELSQRSRVGSAPSMFAGGGVGAWRSKMNSAQSSGDGDGVQQDAAGRVEAGRSGSAPSPSGGGKDESGLTTPLL